MMRSYEALLQALPSPPTTSILNDPPLANRTRRLLFVLETPDNDLAVYDKVKSFTIALRNCRREQVAPLPRPSHYSSVSEYVDNFIMRRIASLLSQLQPNYVSQMLTGSRSSRANHRVLECLTGIKYGLQYFTFHAPSAGRSSRSLRSPIVVLCPPSFYKQVSNPESYEKAVSSFLYEIGAYSRSCIICTDMQQLSVFQVIDNHRVPRFDHQTIDINGNPLCFCVIVAALLYDGLCHSSFPLCLPRSLDDGGEYQALAGPLIHPQSELLPNSVVFRPRHRHSDFDIVSIFRGNNIPMALQLIQWKEHIAGTCHWMFAQPGDVLKVKTHGFFANHVPLMPYYPPEPLPSRTTNHINRYLRPRDSMANRISGSRSFSVTLLQDLTAHDRAVMCRTYRCVVSIKEPNSAQITSDAFCVKLFDDRFMAFGSPSSGAWKDLRRLRPEEQMNVIRRYWDTAEECVRREDAAYRRLGIMQGSLIPHYYGSHTFILPGGHWVYGILMEYIPAYSLVKGIGHSLNTRQQIQLTESVRHAVRVLQYHDVSQHDWHPGQLLCNIKPDLSVHGVLIDFSQTIQSHREGENRMEDDAGDALGTLFDARTGLDVNIVWNHWAPREHWDNRMCLLGRDMDYSLPDPFDFVLEAF